MSYWRNLVAAAVGKPPQAISVSRRASGWQAATTTRRFMKWAARRDSINSLIYQDGERLRDRARDAGRQNPWAASAIESMTANVIGTGIKPQSRHPKKATRELVHRLWDYYVLKADADGRSDFYGQQALAFHSTVEAGECLGRTRYRRSYDDYVIPMQYQLLEPDHLDLNNNQILPSGNVIQSGIEFDKLGQRVAYHLYTRHPHEYLPLGKSTETVRIKADQVDHIYRLMRPGQIRGFSWLAPALAKLYDINEYDDSELLRKKFAAMFVGFITEQDPQDPVINTTADVAAPTVEDETGSEPPEVDFAEMQAGTMVRLGPNEGVEFSKPEDVGGMYAEFMRQQLLAVAAALGCMYEAMTGNVADVNYSSIRSQVLEFRRKAEQWQFNMMVFQMCQPVWERFIRACALAGLIDASDFAANPMDYLLVDWRTPLWEWVDPEKDIRAEILAIRAGLKTRTTSVAERGENVEQIDAQNFADQERADEAGLVYDTNARDRDQAGKSIQAAAAPVDGEAAPATPVEQPQKKKAAERIAIQ